MKPINVCFALAFMSTVACADPSGPVIRGRWATGGIELIATLGTKELRLACNHPARVPGTTRVDREGRIEFVGQFANTWGKRAFEFVGLLRGDTLEATLTFDPSGEAPLSQSYLMTSDGDPGFDRLMCALGAA